MSNLYSNVVRLRREKIETSAAAGCIGRRGTGRGLVMGRGRKK